MEVTMITVVILQAIGGLNYNYIPTQVVDIAENRAKAWAEKGICRILSAEELKIRASLTHVESTGGDPEGCDLPEDLPGRDVFIENNIITLEEVKNYGDWTKLSGIGPATYKDLEKFFNPDPEGCDLPEDFPYREVFIENEIITLEALRNYGDWTQLENIDVDDSAVISDYLEKLDTNGEA